MAQLIIRNLDDADKAGLARARLDVARVLRRFGKFFRMPSDTRMSQRHRSATASQRALLRSALSIIDPAWVHLNEVAWLVVREEGRSGGLDL